jgi:hypothetical protein
MANSNLHERAKIVPGVYTEALDEPDIDIDAIVWEFLFEESERHRRKDGSVDKKARNAAFNKRFSEFMGRLPAGAAMSWCVSRAVLQYVTLDEIIAIVISEHQQQAFLPAGYRARAKWALVERSEAKVRSQRGEEKMRERILKAWAAAKGCDLKDVTWENFAEELDLLRIGLLRASDLEGASHG